MRTATLTSLQDLLEKMRQLVNPNDLPNLDLQNLEKYSDEELHAIEVFLEKSLLSIGNFYSDYGKLLTKFNDEYEKEAYQAIEGEKERSDRQKVDAISTMLKNKK